MTQAFNLAQLANNLNTSGQLDATDGLNGLVANANLASSGSPSSSTYLRGDRTWASLPGFGKVLQVIQAFKSDVFSTTSGTPVEITGLSVNITPSSSSSRILVLSVVNVDGYQAQSNIYLGRNGSYIAQSTAGSSYNGYATSYGFGSGSAGSSMVCVFVDSPATTSSTNYKAYLGVNSATGYVNRTQNGIFGMSSTLTVLEIGA